MKQGIHWVMIVLCACLLYQAAHAEQVQIVTFHYPPMMDRGKPQGGLMGEIVQAAFNEVRIEPDLVFYPAKRMLAYYIGTKAYLACIGPIVLVDRQPEDRQHQVIRIAPLADILMVLLYYKPTHGAKPTAYNALSELRGMKVGTILGSNTTPLLQEAGIEVSEIRIESQIKLLRADRIDFAAVGLLTGLDLITRLFPGQEAEFAFIRKPVMELPTSIYFNKRFPKSDEYAERFRAGLKAIVENGHYLRILEHYYGKGKIPVEYKALFHTLGIQYPF